MPLRPIIVATRDHKILQRLKDGPIEVPVLQSLTANLNRGPGWNRRRFNWAMRELGREGRITVRQGQVRLLGPGFRALEEAVPEPPKGKAH